MKRYILVKILSSALMLMVLSTVIFYAVTFVNIEQFSSPHPLSENFGVTNHLFKSYVRMLFFNHTWGLSLEQNSVGALLKEAIPITLKINLIAFLIYIIVGFYLGYLSGKYSNKFLGKSIANISIFFGSIPPFITVMLLIILLAYRIPIAPPQWNMVYGNFDKYFLIYVIPVIALVLLPMSNVIRNVSAEYKENRTSEYYDFCVAKGLREKYIYKKHIVKNILVAILPELKNIILLVLTNSFFVERIYNIPGVSYLLYDALIKPFDTMYYIYVDTKVAIPVMGFYILLAIAFSLAIDFVYPFLDPRIKFGFKGQKSNR